jgi:hypothetical protein
MTTMRSSGWIPLGVGLAVITGWALIGLGLLCLGLATSLSLAKARATFLAGLPLGVVLLFLGIALVRSS